MTLALTDIGAVEFGVDPDETTTSPDSLLKKLLRGAEAEIIVMLRIGNRPVAGGGADLDDDGDIGTLAFGEASNELAGASPDKSLLLSDGDWCGKPDDFGAAHLEADVRLLDAGDYQERVPLYPEEDRRAVSFGASAEVANDDGFFADWQYERTVEGQTGMLFLAEENGYSRDFLTVAEMRGKSMRAGLTRAYFEFETIADFFGRTPYCRDKWSGNGGSGGDAHLAGRRIQRVIGGPVRNVELVLEDAAFETWRVTAGEYQDILKLKDALAPLPYTGDDFGDDLAALKAATIPPGFYSRCSAIGRVRTNRGGLALGRVTADVIGEVSVKTADILVHAAINTAGAPPQLVNQGSYGALPDDPIGYVAYGEETVEDVFNALLKPFNGWFGPDQTGRLSVGVVNAGLFDNPVFTIDEDEWFDGEPEVADQRPRWAQSVTWNNNWTVMTASEIAPEWESNPNISAEDVAFAQREDDSWRWEDAAVLQRYRLGGVDDGDEVYGPVKGFFTEESGAKKAARALGGWLKLRKIRFRATSGFNLIFSRAGSPGRLIFPEMGLAGGRNFISDERNIRTRDRQIELNGIIAYA